MDSISSDAGRFEDEFALLLEGRSKIPAYQDSIDRYWFVHVPADRPPWTDTGIEVVAGDRLSGFVRDGHGSRNILRPGSKRILRSGCGSANAQRCSGLPKVRSLSPPGIQGAFISAMCFRGNGWMRMGGWPTPPY